MKHRIHLSLLLGLLLISASAVCAASPEDDLLLNVSAIDSGGNPASLIAWGDAQPLVVSPKGDIYAVASTLGAGRVIALGHGGFIGDQRANTPAFIANAVQWLAGDRKQSAKGVVRVWGLNDQLEQVLIQRGRTIERVPGRVRDLTLDDVDVILGSPQAFAKAGLHDDLERWIRHGGGMLITETAWGILQLNPDLTLDTLAANQMLEDAGMRFTGDAHSGYGDNKNYAVNLALLESANADRALDVLTGDEPGDAVFAAKIVGRAFSGVPVKSSLITRAQRIAKSHRAELDEAYSAMTDRRLTPKNDPLACALFDLDARLAMELPPQKIKAHPSSAAFPGPVGPDRAARLTIELDPATPGWRSTGLYAPPGEVVIVQVPRDAVNAGVVVQIGAWRDPHTHAHRVRMKHALRRYPITSIRTPIASAIGGPIYIDLPANFRDAWSKPTLPITIRSAAKAPHYIHGVTDLDAWCDTIRHFDAPWAEFESDQLVLTIPSAMIRDVDRPDLVMNHWDAVHEAMQSLEPRTGNHWADRQYRYVADASVSWGYMYCPANGPIVIPLKPARAMFELENFDADGPNQLWGHYHEMGHAHQNQLWTDGATTEVTVNIFTVYALHMVNGYPLDSEVMRCDHQKAWETFEAHRASGKRFEDVGGPFPRLQFYALLWHEFGFEAFHKAFDTMRTVTGADRPKNTTEERNLQLVHFSEATGRNLTPYFEAWGIEVTDAAREKTAPLEAWTPAAPQLHARD